MATLPRAKRLTTPRRFPFGAQAARTQIDPCSSAATFWSTFGLAPPWPPFRFKLIERRWLGGTLRRAAVKD